MYRYFCKNLEILTVQVEYICRIRIAPGAINGLSFAQPKFIFVFFSLTAFGPNSAAQALLYAPEATIPLFLPRKTFFHFTEAIFE